MNKLREDLRNPSLTHLLLFVLLIVVLLNYFETRRVHTALAPLYVANLGIGEKTEVIDQGINAINDYLNEMNDSLDHIDKSTECVANHRPACPDIQ